jgi:tetratricopeptide (TPR) repeat protein
VRVSPVRMAHRLLRRGRAGDKDSLFNVMLMVRVADELAQLENYGEELPLRERTFEFCDRQYPAPVPIYSQGFFADHPELAVVGSKFFLFKCRLALGQYQAADTLITQVESEMVRAIGSKDPTVLEIRRWKAQLNERLGRLEDARDSFLEIWQDYEDLGLLHIPEAHSATFGLLPVLNTLHDNERALQIARKILAVNSDQYGPDHPQTLEALEMVAQFLFLTENLSEALVVATSLSEQRFRLVNKDQGAEDAVRAQTILESIRAAIASST